MPTSPFRSLSIAFIVLALLCVVGLDYIRWQRMEESWIFKTRRAAPPTLGLHETPGKIIQAQIQSLGISSKAVSQYRDSEGILHMMLELTPEQYQSLEQALDLEFSRIQAQTTKHAREGQADKSYILWRIQDQSKQLLSLLVSFPKSADHKPDIPPERPPFAKNKVAIIMDDMGNSLEAIEQLSQLGQAITIAILPFSSMAHETASIARQNNLEVILHLPLESLYNDYDNTHTKGIIHSDMSPQEIIQAVQTSMGQVPYIDGVNTHMGSKITSSPELIRIILQELKGRGLYFIDSRTTAESVAFDEARSLGIPTAFRNVFLDNEVNEVFIRNQLIRLFQYAQQNGTAVGICHPSPETLKVLRENLHLLESYGLQAVFASEVVQ